MNFYLFFFFMIASTLSIPLYVFQIERDGKQGVSDKGHTNVWLYYRNRNRLPVIVRQNGTRRWGRRERVRRVPCHSALLRNYRICTYVGTQTVPALNPECTTRHGFEATDAASISPMITIADTVPVSRCYVTIGSYRRRIRRCSPTFCQRCVCRVACNSHPRDRYIAIYFFAR